VKAAEHPANGLLEISVPIRPDFRVLDPLFNVTLSMMIAFPESPTPDSVFTRPYPAIFLP